MKKKHLFQLVLILFLSAGLASCASKKKKKKKCDTCPTWSYVDYEK